jgi:Txe/YoeB family toxin of Txe-Axe toxin-antitoxin module
VESKVVFGDVELKESFKELEKTDPRLFKEIEKALEDISRNAFCGRNVKKYLIPTSIKHKWNVDNLWIYNLRKDWRLLYVITPGEIEIIAVVLDWMNHKDYERLFGF